MVSEAPVLCDSGQFRSHRRTLPHLVALHCQPAREAFGGHEPMRSAPHMPPTRQHGPQHRACVAGSWPLHDCYPKAGAEDVGQCCNDLISALELPDSDLCMEIIAVLSGHLVLL